MNRTHEVYVKLLRVAVFFVVGFLWYLSIIWSADGFSINDPELVYIGYGLALSVTIVQLVFNRGSANPTIFLVGLAAYIYGFATNFLGISRVIGLDFTINNFTSNPFGFIASGAGVAALSAIVEAAPESFLLWALYPKEQSPGDFVSSLMGGINLPSPGRRSKRSRSVPRSNFVQEHSKNVPSSPMNIPTLPHQQEVFAYIRKYLKDNRGKMPSYKKIVQNTKVSSTSVVKDYVTAFKISSGAQI